METYEEKKEQFAAYFVMELNTLRSDPAFQEHFGPVRLKLTNFLMNLQRKTVQRFEGKPEEAVSRMLCYEEILNALALLEGAVVPPGKPERKRPKLINTEAT